MKELHLALIGGTRYDGLLELLPRWRSWNDKVEK